MSRRMRSPLVILVMVLLSLPALFMGPRIGRVAADDAPVAAQAQALTKSAPEAPAPTAPVATILDDTAATATNDGTINVGEYVGFTTGINSGFGNVIGSGSQLHVDSDAGGNLNVGLIKGVGGYNDAMVIYIDSVAGGYSSTSTFDDTADGCRRAISGYDGSNRSVLNFAPGFQADYAICMDTGFAGVWQLAATGSHPFVASANRTTTTSGHYEMNLTMANLGLAAGGTFKYVATYLNPGNAFRSDEFHGVAQSTVPGGNPGHTTVNLATDDYNLFTSYAVVVVSAGGSSAGYATLKDAFDAINAGTHTGSVDVKINGDTTEPAAGAILNASGSGSASYTSILIRPSGGRTISGAATAGSPLIDLNGADNVTIDGLNTGGNSLTIANTTVSATSGTSTIRFIGGATNNTITNSTIQGSGTMSVATNGATIFFSTDANTANGNDNNTISNNNIGPAGANLPTKAILGNGSQTTTAIGNSGIVITNNNIYDFFGAAVTSSGIAINGGCNTWSITDNRFYQTGTRTWTTGATHRAIDLNSSTATHGVQAMTVTGNTVGYASGTQTGTYTLTGSTGKFQGIVFNGITGAAASTISNNTIASVSLTGVTSSGTSTSSPFMGILVTNGLANTNNNTIGSQSTTGSLVFSTNSTTTTDVYGIYNFSLDDWTANENSIGGISVTNTAASGTYILYGMRANTSTSKVWNAGNNLVGGTAANSLQVTATGTASQVVGMQAASVGANLSRNTIRNLSINIGTGTTSSASAIGISVTSTTPNHTLSQNTITNLTNTNATGASVVTGIQFTGGTANLVERNLITGLTVATNSTSAEVNGIRVAGGTTIYRNNMIALGAGIANALGAAATNSSVAGINGINEFLGTNQFFHNSVYIGGTATAGTGSSFAFNGTQTINTRSFRDNIFFNGRTNSGATGKHYAVKINGTTPNPAGLTINNNVYFANGSGAVFGFFNSLDVANLAAWQAAVGQDANSFEADPLYVSTTDLHLQAGSPAIDQAANLGVTNDFDGDSRPGLNALYDIGADERDGIPAVVNDMQATAFIDPTNGGAKLAGSSFSPQASFTNNGTANQTSVTVRYRIVDGSMVEIYNQTATIASIASLATANVTFPSTSIATPGTYTIYAKSELGSDTVPANDQIVGTLFVMAPLAGTYTVGSGGNYPSLTNNGGIFQALNSLGASANITIDIISDLTGELGTHALNEIAGGYTVLIKPSGAPRTVTGSINGALIRLNGADRVTIDGSTAAMAAVGGNPALRELTIQNTNTGTSAVVIAVQSGTNGAQNNTIKNVNVLGQDPTTTLLGISLGGNTPGTGGTDNDGNRVENCSVKRAIFGIYSAGASANPNTGTVITQNDLSATATDRVRRVGILVFNEDGVQITENSIGGIETNESADAIGIGVGTQAVDTFNTTSGGVINAFVSRNKVNGVNSASTVGFSAAGIAVAGGTGGANTIVNNMITGVTAPSTSPDLVAGIFVVGAVGSNTRLYYNSVANTGDRGAVASQMPSYGLAVTGTDPTLTLRNNIFYTTQTASGGGVNAESYAIGMATTTFANLDSNYNAFYSSGANDGGFRTGSLSTAAGTDYAALAGWQTAVSDDANSIEADPLFVNPLSDLHITNIASPVSNVATPIATVLEDFDGQPRTGALRNPVAPDMGADEFLPANAIELLGFTAEALGLDAVRLTWETATEVNLAGYFVYRSASPDVLGDAVNTQMIASQGVQGQGAAYELIDANLLPGVYYYTLEDVDLAGLRTAHGPVMVEVGVPSAVGLQAGATAGAPARLPAILVAVALLLTVTVVWLRRRAA